MTEGRSRPPVPLPIDEHVPLVRDHLARRRAVVVAASPGAGKTTRIPPALAADGPVLVLQPRRIAARAIATRIADEQGMTLGDEVGWQVRFERRFTTRTRVLVATEGILTARLHADPLLSAFTTVVLDEFHERSIHTDVGLALTRVAWRARDDLRIVVMSATLDAGPIARFLDDCPVLAVPARLHPLEMRYLPRAPVAEGVLAALAATGGSVLAFLPGAAEIRRAHDVLSPVLAARGIECVALHGSLDPAAQAAAVTGVTRRVVLATNIAETSLTVAGVTAVVDSGLQKVARFDAERGLDRLDLERIGADSADQRAGRAGRLGPGLVIRLWDERDRLRPAREPEIVRVDLAGPALDVAAAGEDPARFEWFEAPDADRLGLALSTLRRIGALDAAGRITAHGERLRRFPLPPRLAELLVAAHGSRDAARVAALLSEAPDRSDAGGAATSGRPGAGPTVDVLRQLDGLDRRAPHVARVAGDLERIAHQVLGPQRRPASDDDLRRAILSAYPDRVARVRAPGGDRLLLATGQGARLAGPDLVQAPFVVALDVRAARADADALVRLAVAIEPDWLEHTSEDVQHRLDEQGVVRATRRRLLDAIVLDEHAVAADPDVRARLLANAYLARGPSDDDMRLLRRLTFARLPVSWEALVAEAARAAGRLSEMAPSRHLEPGAMRAIDRLAPDSFEVPSGRRVRLDYPAEGGVTAAVKLQELFGLGDTPRIGPAGTPVVFQLLAPNGRPVQTTSDLRSFWNGAYAEVRRELRGRYPKHPWPEDPWSATPTHRTKRRT